MRKRRVLIILALCAVLFSAGAQVRFEIGVTAPVTGGYVTGDGATFGSLVEFIDAFGIIPFGNLGLFLEADLGLLKLGAGVKAHTFLLASAAYPAVQAELELGRLFVDMSVGGYYVGYYAVGDLYGIEKLEILFPDASVWLGLGKNKNIRLGGGAFGIVPISLDLAEIPFVAYAGLKVVL